MRRALTTLLLLALAACAGSDGPEEIEFARPETAIDYDVSISGVEDEKSVELLEKALELYRQQEDGAPSLAFLRRRAQDDLGTIDKAMRSFGYYESETRFEIDPPPPAPAVKPKDGEEVEPPKAAVRILIEPGRRYTLARHDFLLVETGAGEPPAQPDAAALGSPVGAPAVAEKILDAESAAVEGLRKAGRPYAKRLGRDAVADPASAEIEVETTVATGPPLVFGTVTYEGGENVRRDYLDTYLTFQPGETANPEKLQEFQRELAKTNLFDTAAASFPKDPPPGPEVPVTVRLEEAKPRTVSLGAFYSTDSGPSVKAGFAHRNIFGANETFTLEGLAGLEEQKVDFDYRRPQWRRPGQDLVYHLQLRHVDDDAYEELAATLSLGVEREISDQLTVGLGGLAEIARVDDEDGEPAETSRLVGLPAFAAYDGTDDELDPTKGFRARLNATPYAGYVGDDPAAFMVLDSALSTYFDLTGEKRYIFAARGRLGTIVAGDLDVVSANRRLYSGGGGSIRGYREKFVGPLDDNGDPVGGLSVVELGAEMRARISGSFGVVGFVEAGSVTEDPYPSFDEGVQVAAGAGVRYYSPIGPLRVDVGVPLDRREEDDAFQVYISIGQAF